MICAEAANAGVSLRDIRMETLVFPVPVFSSGESRDRMVEKTIIGRFYTDKEAPVIDASSGGGDSNPFELLAAVLHLSQSDGFDKLPTLYSPETRSVVVSGLANETSGANVLAWMKSLRRFIVLGMWIESPNRLIVYVRVNDLSGVVLPYMFEFNDGRWYISAGTLNSELSNDLDGFYTKYQNRNMEVLFPPSVSAADLLLRDRELVQFSSEIGINLSTFDKN